MPQGHLSVVSSPLLFSLSLSLFYSQGLACSGLEIVSHTIAHVTKTFNLATKNSGSVATLATMFL